MSTAGDRLQKPIQDYADAYPNVTEDQAKDMVDEMIAIRHDELKVRTSHLSKFRKALPGVKVAWFLQIANKIDAIVNLGLADATPLVESGG